MDQAAILTAGPEGLLRLHTKRRFASGIIVAPALDVRLAPGSVLVLFGPSGAGKTTMLRQIAGLERPDAGTIAFGGEIWCDSARRLWRPPQARRVGVVSQEPTLFPHLSVTDNLLYGVRHRGSPTTVSDTVAEIATILGIDDLKDRLPRQLSAGQTQRVALARALTPGPRLLLMDEPFAALDAPTRVRLRRDVHQLLNSCGTPAVLVTHDRAEALVMGDTVAVVIGGRVRQTGATSDVFSRPADADVAASLGVEAVLPGRIRSVADGLLTVAIGGVELTVADRPDRDREPLAAGADVYACIRAEDVTIELRSAAHASTRNHLAARVTAIGSEGPVERVSLECGFPLDALITRRSREELGLAPGTTVTAAIKATSIHLVARS
jgi:molybdate transport system ATP-binding protein